MRFRFGELDVAADEHDGRRRPPLSEPGERYTGDVALCVGVGGSEVFCREFGERGELGVEDPSPEAASVSRNSTQRREND